MTSKEKILAQQGPSQSNQDTMWSLKLSDENKAKIKSIIKGALIAGAGLALVSAAEALKVADFGDNQALAVAVASILVNVGKVLAKL